MSIASSPLKTFEDLGLMDLPVEGPMPDGGTIVTGLAVDSRNVREGFVFIAIPGTRLDGADFADFAIRQGAACVVVTQEGAGKIFHQTGELVVPTFVSEDPRALLPRLAARFYTHQPGTIAAVTGTNGKTSSAHFLHQIWTASGHRSVVFGTAGIEGMGITDGPGLTTPEPIALHALLDDLAVRGFTHAAMEASSHGLSQHRLDGVRLRAGGLTNIARDHLDYHADFDAYVAAKLRLFGEVLPDDGVAVLNTDDPISHTAAKIASGRGLRVISVGAHEKADLRIVSSRFSPTGQRVVFRWENHDFPVVLELIGGFQAENVAMAAGLALAVGDTTEAVFAALPTLHGVRGRMERVAERRNGAAVYVDYAHTPDALARAIDALRPHCHGRLVVVFGAGGDRDRGKRPLMGDAVCRRADMAIVTDDNPRSEDPAAIRAAIMTAIPEANEIGDRTAAILAGLDALKEPGDCLLIAGKGHEQGQEICGEIRPFDDAEQARASVIALDGMAERIGGGR